MKVVTMISFILIATFYLMTSGSTQGRVLEEIIDILADNPRTRALFLNAIAARKGYPTQIGLVHPYIDQRYLYALTRRLPQVLPLPDGEAYFNMENKAARPPLLPNIKDVGHPDTGMRMTEQDDAPLDPPAAPTNPFVPKGEDEASGVALDINGDMKANIPYDLQWNSQPQPAYGMLPPSPHRDYMQRVPVDINNNAIYMPTDHFNRGPLSDKVFQKKRTIIRELKSLFQVILGADVTMRRHVHRRTLHHNPFHRARIDSRPKSSQNVSTKLKGVKRGKISRTPHQTNKRIVLYRKLINDLNDLITLEISKNNKTNAFEGVEQLAPAKLRRTIPKQEARSSKVVE